MDLYIHRSIHLHGTVHHLSMSLFNLYINRVYGPGDFLIIMPPPGMLRGVAIVRTDVTEERILSVIRVTRNVVSGDSTPSQHASVASY
jgi:hypothetical protein